MNSEELFLEVESVLIELRDDYLPENADAVAKINDLLKAVAQVMDGTEG